MATACDVFISHCCRTTKEVGLVLHDYLEEAGVSTFICLEMEAGTSFRNKINFNASNCKVMIILLDQAWTESTECESEFNCAFNCYTHEGAPEMLPIVIGGFKWINHKTQEGARAHCVTSNFQCMQIISGTQEEQGDICKKVLSRCSAVINERSKKKIAEKKSEDNLSTLANLRNFITCEICQEIFTEPRLMPCNHTFCLHCLQDWEKESLNNYQDFTCPKCRIPCSDPVLQLKTDFRANQLVELTENDSKIKSSSQQLLESSNQSSNSSNQAEGGVSRELLNWFQSYNIPQDVQNTMIEEGFESLDLVLELTEDDLKTMDLKTGHRHRIVKSISEHKKKHEQTSGASNAKEVNNEFQMIEDIYDERSLKTGTTPADSIKFWASMSKSRLDDVTKHIKSLGESIERDGTKTFEVKARHLSKLAMVLCDAGNFADAETFATASLGFEKDTPRSYNTKLMLAYIVQQKLKQAKFIDKKSAANWNNLSGICDEIIKNGSTYLEKAKLCKLYVIKSFSIQSMCENDTSWRKKKGKEGIEAIEKALELCDEMGGAEACGLRAEAFMTQGLILFAISSKNRNQQIRLLLESRKLCLDTYGEFSSLMSRIYHNLGIDFEICEPPKWEEAYECFRRSWLIDRQLWGAHHPNTKKSAEVLDESQYQEIAQIKKDPRKEEDPGLNDINYKSRVAFLDTLVV